MADLKTTNIYGDAYINNKVGINTNAPATRLQIGQLSPTAATEGIQFGDDTGARLHRINTGHIRATGGFSSATFLIADNYLQTNNNLIYPAGFSSTQRLEVGNLNQNAWIDGLTIAPGGIVTVYSDLFVNNQLQVKNDNPTITFSDTNSSSSFIHVNGNIFHILGGPPNAVFGGWSIGPNGRWPLEINLTNNNATFGGNVDAISFTGAGTGLTGTAANLTAGTATTANALNTSNNYQVNSIGIGMAGSGTAGKLSLNQAGVRSWSITPTGGRLVIEAGDGLGSAIFSCPLTSSNFVGPGTGLTGTAAGLSIGGSAASLSSMNISQFTNNSNYQYHRTDITSLSGSATNLVQPIGTFDGANITGSPTLGAWYNYLSSTHASYLTSLIANEHRTANWYVAYRESNLGSPTNPSWYKLLHSGNYTDYPTNANAISFTEVDLNAPATVSGTWTSGNGSEWGEPKFGTSFNKYRYTDGNGPYVEYNIPANHHACFISQLQWDTGGYADCHGVQSDGDLVFLRRINTRQLVENSNHGNTIQHDGATVSFVGSGLQAFTKIRITNRSGRIHMTGIAFTRQIDDGYEGTGMVHPAQISHQGSGSGLDADLLDGYNSATANTINTIVLRDGSGNFSAGTITATLSGTATTANALNTGNSYTVTALTATSEVGTRGTNIGANLERGNSALSTLRFDSDAFRLYAGGTGGVGEVFKITEAGYVGIGSSPSVKFVVMDVDVNNYTKTTTPTAIIADDDVEFLIGSTDNIAGEEITLRLGTVHSTYYTYSAYVKSIQGSGVDYYKLAFGTSNGAAAATRMTIDNVGNVGIGTTSPNDMLTIAAGNYLSFQTSVTTFNSGRGSRIGITSTGSGIGELIFETYRGGSGGGEKMRISSTGDVGIGTTVTAARLHVNSTTAGTTLLRTDGTNGTLFSVVDDLSDSLMSVNNSAGLPVLEVFADDRIVAGQYGQNDFVIRNNRVGIGTNNPSFKLDVTGSFGLNAGTSDGNWPFIVADTISSGGTNRYALNKTGAMGFNNADNYAQLQLVGSSGAYIDFCNSSTDDQDARLIYYSNSRFDLVYGTTLTMHANGVGIGTTLPQALLHVNGVISGSSFSGAGTGLTGTAASLTAGAANSVAWTNVSGRPTAVSSFTNDSGYLTSAGTIATATNATQLGGVAAASYVTLTGTQTLLNKTLSGSLIKVSNGQTITEYSGYIATPNDWPTCTEKARIYTVGTINDSAPYNSFIEIEVYGSHRGYDTTSYYEYKRWVLLLGDKVSSNLVSCAGTAHHVGLWNGTDANGFNSSTAAGTVLRLVVLPRCGAGQEYVVKVKYANVNFTQGTFTYTNLANNPSVPSIGNQTINISGNAATATALTSMNISQFTNNSGYLTSVTITDGSITAAKLATDAVTTVKIVDANVTAAKLATDSVTASKLPDGVITTVKIADANVTAAKLATDAVTTVKIADANVTTAKLATDAVTSIKIANSNVTLAKIENISTGRILGNNGASAAAPLALTAAQVAAMLSGQPMNIDGNCTGTAASLIAVNSYTVANFTANGMTQLVGVKETYVAVAPVANVVTIDLNTGTVFRLNYNAIINSFTLNNVTANKVNSFTLISIPAAGAGGINFTFTGNTLKWAGATAPTATTTAGKFDVFSFIYDGTNWYGFVGGLNY